MRFATNLGNSQASHNAWLYSVVYTSRVVVLAVFFLFVSFLIQPLHQAVAAEETDSETEEKASAEDVEEHNADDTDDAGDQSDETPSDEDEPIEDEQTAGSETDGPANDTVTEETNEEEAESSENEDNANQENSAENSSEDNSTVNEDETASSTEEANSEEEDNTETSTTSATSTNSVQDNATSTSDNSTASTTEEASSASTTEPVATSTATTTDGSATSSGGDQTDSDTHDGSKDESTSSTTTEDNNSESLNQVATSSDQDTATTAEDEMIESGVEGIVDEVVNLTKKLVTEENYYQFSRKSCSPVGDGTFHCTTQSGAQPDIDSGVYAEKDDEGDMEIFLKTTRGEVRQITDNQLDDTAPDFDGESMQLVWQRLIDDRYQIIVYDLEEEKETQLTFSRTNNMDPKVSADGITWQSWDGNDWEIMYFDGKYTEQITENAVQDVTPVIEEGHILWSVLGGDEQEARVYSLEKGETLTISGYEGGSIANPRFVLVYDTKFENGDVVTQGFDPATGMSAPISAEPTSDPIDIPESDPIGEIRALIQTKSNEKESQVETDNSSDKTNKDLNLSASSTSSSSDTLVIENSLDEDDEDQAESEETEDFELSEYDLVITPDGVSTTSSTSDQVSATASSSAQD